MVIDKQRSRRIVSELAQEAPFRFVVQVVYLDKKEVETVLHSEGLPGRYVDNVKINNYALLESAAHSSGVLRNAVAARVPLSDDNRLYGADFYEVKSHSMQYLFANILPYGTSRPEAIAAADL
ncbi:MAG: hypothetical protein D6732_17420 [Methanobacteriota archaeon]|nr:MAG: hypothetical protein D6732_17420 [Euryarchaeota archaeon]